MDQKHRLTLKKNYVSLENDLDPIDVLDTLVDNEILSDNDCEMITRSGTRKLRCQVFLSILPTRGPSAFESFRKALIAAKYDDLEKRLSEYEKRLETTVNREDKGASNNQCTTCSEYLPETSKSSPFHNVFQYCCCIFVDNLDPIDVLAYHIQEDILTENECERIRQSPTRGSRCRLFLWYLSKSKSKYALTVLIKSVNKKYRFIAEHLKRHHCSTGDELDSQPLGLNDTTGANIATNASQYGHLSNDKDDQEMRRLVNPDSNVKRQKNGYGRNETSVSNADSKCSTQCLGEQTLHESQISVYSTPCAFSSRHLSQKYLLETFDCLSCLINQGRYDLYGLYASKISELYKTDFDMLNLIGYLDASKDLFQNDLNGAKKHIRQALQLAPKTRNFQYSVLELLTAKSRMYLIQRKFGKLQSTLDNGKMIVEGNRVEHSGRAAGWLYVNDARLLTCQMALIHIRSRGSAEAYEILHKQARNRFETALMHFQQDQGKDGPFGVGFTLCNLVVLLLRCSENGLSMGILSPPKEDMVTADRYIQYLKQGEIPMPKVLRVLFFIAKSDYQFRSSNVSKATEYAEKACNIATNLGLIEYIENARNRLMFLRIKKPFRLKQINMERKISETLIGSMSSREICT